MSALPEDQYAVRSWRPQRPIPIVPRPQARGSPAGTAFRPSRGCDSRCVPRWIRRYKIGEAATPRLFLELRPTGDASGPQSITSHAGDAPNVRAPILREDGVGLPSNHAPRHNGARSTAGIRQSTRNAAPGQAASVPQRAAVDQPAHTPVRRTHPYST